MASISTSRVSLTIDILGHEVAVDGSAWVVEASRHALSGTRPMLHIVTLNPEYVMRARREPAFRDSLNRAGVTTADGIGIVIAARLLRRPARPRRATGFDVLGALAELSADADAPIFFLGGRSGVGEQAAQRLKVTEPNARIAGWWSDGSAEPAHDEESIRRIQACGARVVLVAYGAPGQVVWIERNRAALERANVRIAVGIGGALDYAAGTAHRPSAAVRRLGLEWGYRLAREPWRWRRQLDLPRFVALAVRTAINERVTARARR